MDLTIIDEYLNYQKQIENFIAVRSQLSPAQIKQAEALLIAQKAALQAPQPTQSSNVSIPKKDSKNQEEPTSPSQTDTTDSTLDQLNVDN